MAQFKEFLRTGLFALIVLCGVAGCDKDDEPIEKNYEFDEVTWMLQGYDNVEIVKESLPGFMVNNYTEDLIPVSVSPTENVNETSSFFPNDINMFKLLNQQPNEISVPNGLSPIPTDDFSYVSSFFKVPFSLDEYKVPRKIEITHKSSVPPHHRLIYNHIISYRKITATYRARYTETNTGEMVELTGKWIGKIFIKNEGELTLEEIK